MKLFLNGVQHKYAVEQMLFTLYPGERPEYIDAPTSEDSIRFSQSRGSRFTTVTCCVRKDGAEGYGRAAISNEKMIDAVMEDRHLQRMIKMAFYRAALRAGHEKLVWGALTGVRPGKLMTELLHASGDPEKALVEFQDIYDVSPERAQLCLDTSRYTEQASSLLTDRDICLYVGIPFCPTRCDYCSFVSQSVEKSMQLIPPFLDALLKEIAATAEAVRALGLRVISVYFGGGTPTTLSAQQLDTLIRTMEQQFDLSQLMEFTVEAGRPDTITEEKLAVLKAHGVSRISVNPQTMSDAVLEEIGRKHTAADVLSALSLVRRTGGFSINMDLIAGLTGDSAAGFQTTLDTVLDLRPENITVHTLSRKKGSRVTKEQKRIPGPDEVSSMLDYAMAELREHDYRPYYLYRQKNMSGGFENVGWTLEGHENLYNICIMEELCSIVAMGGGGSTKLVCPGNGKNIRLMAPKYPYEYISHIDKVCGDKEKIKEFYNVLSAGRD